jgi:AAA family ATP:ADP antiporter
MRAADHSTSTRPATRGEHRSRRQRGALTRLFGDRFLLAAGMLALLLSWASANGENLLFHVVQEAVAQDAAVATPNAAAALEHTRNATTAFYGDFYFWTNLMAMGAQALIASRIKKRRGLAVILLALPILALLASATLVLAPALAIVKWVKVAERATDYSLNQTASQVLWLPASAEAKYEGKPTVDALFGRIGDGFAALTMLASGTVTGHMTVFVTVNVVLAVLWMLAAWIAVHEHGRLVTCAAGAPATRRTRRYGTVVLRASLTDDRRHPQPLVFAAATG